MSDWLSLLPRRLQWWYAKRSGESPVCEDCGESAYWYSSGGYYCLMCESQRTTSVGFIRELEPRDYLDD